MNRFTYYLSSIPTLLTGFKNWPVLFGLLFGRGPAILKLRDGLQLKVQTLMDAWIVKETCLDRQYEAASVPLAENWTIIDVGAALGDFAVSVARRFPRSVIYAFEPYDVSYHLIRENAALNGVGNVRAIPLAVGHESGMVTLQFTSGEAVQHSTAATAASATSAASLSVQSVTLEQIFEENQLGVCDYLKMDCEGAEFDILLNLSPALLGKIRHICLEYHDGVTPHSHRDLARFFEEYGFRVRLTPNPVHGNLGYLYAANGNL